MNSAVKWDWVRNRNRFKDLGGAKWCAERFRNGGFPCFPLMNQTHRQAASGREGENKVMPKVRTAPTFEGNPCARAAHTLRYCRSGACVQCGIDYRDRPGVKEREAERAKTPEGKERQRISHNKPTAKAARAEYAKTDASKASVKAGQAKYFQTEKGRASRLKASRKHTAKLKAERLASKLIRPYNKEDGAVRNDASRSSIKSDVQQ